MGFFRRLFGTSSAETVALIDIGSGSIAGALLVMREHAVPVIVYTRRLPIEPQQDEAQERAMLRAFELLCATLVREGLPALVRATGHRSVRTVLISVDAPWQETLVHEEQILEEKEFIFTRRLANDVLRKATLGSEGKIITDARIMGTRLNGFTIRNPFGKRVRQASIIVLISSIDERVHEVLDMVVDKTFNPQRVSIIAGSALRYQALRAVFPHERDALIVDATGPFAEVALVHRSQLVAVSHQSDLPNGTPKTERAEQLTLCFKELASSYPLPRTIFLIARDNEIETLQTTLKAVHFGPLWLYDTEPRIVLIEAKHLQKNIRQLSTGAPDVPLQLSAIFLEASRLDNAQ